MRVLYPIKEGKRQEKVIDWGRDPEGAPYGVRDRELARLAKRRDSMTEWVKA